MVFRQRTIKGTIKGTLQRSDFNWLWVVSGALRAHEAPLSKKLFIGLPVKARSTFCFVEKRHNCRRNSQRALRVPFALQWGRFFGEGTGHFKSSGEVDLERTQIFCVELFALYLRRMIIELKYSMMLFACAWATETMLYHGPRRKNLLQFFPYKKGICYL